MRIEMKPGAVRSILRSAEVLRDLDRRAQRISIAAGPGHAVVSEIGQNRGSSAVFTITFEAMLAEATTRALTMAIDAGR